MAKETFIGFDPLPAPRTVPFGSRAVKLSDARLSRHDRFASICPAASIRMLRVIVEFLSIRPLKVLVVACGGALTVTVMVEFAVAPPPVTVRV